MPGIGSAPIDAADNIWSSWAFRGLTRYGCPHVFWDSLAVCWFGIFFKLSVASRCYYACITRRYRDLRCRFCALAPSEACRVPDTTRLDASFKVCLERLRQG